MKAIGINKSNSKNKLTIITTEIPTISETQILVKVSYAGINRADILQRNGMYPPPPGESEILGLEFSGEIVEMGDKVDLWNLGDYVCGIVAGGSYAEYVKIEANHLIKVPENLTLTEAGVIPEAFITAYQSLIHIANIAANEIVLIHAGASGVGAAAIQMAKSIGAIVIITASKEKHEFCYNLGADLCIDYKNQAFDEVLLSKFPKGVNIVLDLIGASHFQKNLNVLSRDGKMVMLGFLGGVNISEANIAAIIAKRLKIEGSTLRNRNNEYKSALVKGFSNQFLNDSKFPFKPNLDIIFPWANTDQAHEYMVQNKNKGKIAIEIKA